MGALYYNLKKLYHPEEHLRAELIDSNFASLDDKLIKQEVDLIRGLRPNLNRYVYHASLNFAKDDALTNAKLLRIAHDFLQESGFDKNQYMIFRHHDADHPHIHLLANRIGFDGSVVSDSNNYKKGEEILRKLEYKYGLKKVQSSNEAQNHAVKKDEIEKVLRTGKPSDKMVLQEKLKELIGGQRLSISQLISQGEQLNINFLFNQASTGRITGISYFYNGFKIKGQALGNQFKWAELIKKVSYEQIRDREAISQANDRTRTKYGTAIAAASGTDTTEQWRTGAGLVSQNVGGDSSEYGGFEAKHGNDTKGSMEANTNADILDNHTADIEPDNINHSHGIEISDDIDDEAIHGRSRYRQKKARTNRR